MTDLSAEMLARIAALPPEKRAMLEQRLRAMKPAADDDIPVVPRDGALPLSFSEQRLWFIEQYDPGQATYNLPLALRLRGVLDERALGTAARGLVARHETLRTRYGQDAGQPFRVVDAPSDVSIDVAEIGESDLADWLAREERRPFDLAKGPLFRVALARLAADDHVLVMSMHHVVSDGWSFDVLLRDLGELYAAAREGRTPKLPPLAIQYADFAAWQRARLSGNRVEASLAFFRERLAGLPVLELPTDRARPPTQSNVGASLAFELDAALSGRLRELAKKHGSLFAVMLAAFEVLLWRHSGQKDFAIGAPDAQRNRVETEGLVGFFVNMLVLRAELAGDPTVAELLRRVHGGIVAAQTHAEVPFERIVEALEVPRDPSRTPLFQVTVASVGASGAKGSTMPGLAIEPLRPALGIAQDDLSLLFADGFFVQAGSGKIACTLNYATALFDAGTIERMARELRVILEAFVARPDARVSDVPLLEDGDRASIIERASAPALAGKIARADELVARWAKETPDAPAIVEGELVVSFGELHRRARGVAAALHGAGVRRGDRVAISATRRHQTFIGILAALIAGAAYVPIDPKLPSARSRSMLERCGARVGLGYGDLASIVGVELRLDMAHETEHAHDGGDVVGDAMVVLHTSGTTGEPKGVVLSHRGLVSYATAMAKTWQVTREDRVLQFAALSFDASLEELLLSWVSGGALVLRDDAMLDAVRLLEACDAQRVTLLDVTTAYLSSLLEGAESRGGWPSSLRLVVIGGERADRAVVERFCRSRGAPELWSTYGPTEASISVTACAMDEARASWTTARAPLGSIVPGCSVHVLDERLQPVPIGVPGEICIGGTPLALGYVGDAAQTSERFVPSPFVRGARLYRTGDVGLLRADGQLEFVGRVDDQIKLRGHRIEPSEVAAVLGRHPSVEDAHVLARDGVLVGYVRTNAMIDVGKIREFAGAHLPAYMVPSAFVVLDRWPLTRHGKLDRAALPPPDRSTLHADYVAPRTETEARLAAIWCEVLGAPRVGATDDFFALGGHSLLVTKLVSRVRRELGVELGVRVVFEHPTLEGLAAELADDRPAADTAAAIERVSHAPLSFAEQRLWFIDQYEAGKSTYNLPLALRLEGSLDVPALAAALRALVTRHDTLRTRYVGEGGVPSRVVDAPSDVPLETARVRKDDLRAWLAQREAEPFDLARGPLFRAHLAEVSTSEHVLLLCMHHIVSDGWSIDVMVRDLGELYAATIERRAAQLAELPIRYGDWAAWQKKRLSGERLEAGIAYWRDRLAALPALELPTDRARPAVVSDAGALEPFELDAASAQRLRELARRHGGSIFTVILAGFAVLLSRYSGQKDFAIGAPEAQRNRVETEGLVGFFVNMLALRVSLEGDPTVVEMLERTRETCLAAQTHAEVPFERIIEAVELPRDPSRAPLFQVSVAAQSSAGDVRWPGLEIVHVRPAAESAKFDLTLYYGESPEGGIRGALSYATALFDASRMERMSRHLRAVLEAMARSEEARVSQIDFTGEVERQQLLGTSTGAMVREDFVPAHHLVERWAATSPDALAVKDARASLSYAELDRRANRLARWLRARGIGRGVAVAVCLPRSVGMIVSQLAVLKAGGHYVSLDPSQPPERLLAMAREAKIGCALTTPAHVGRDWGAQASLCDAPEIARESDAPLGTSVHEDDLAYIIFTSGSTGVPKGVQLRHGGLANLVRTYARTFELGPRDRSSQTAAPSFDSSVAEIWPALCAGSALCIPPDEARSEPRALVTWMRDERVTVCFMPTPLGEACLAEDWTGSSLRILMIAGDKLHTVDARRTFAIDNQYGPTEYTVCTTHHWLERDVVATPSIGRPLDNTRTYVLDAQLRPSAIGVPGELYIAGLGLARGYTRPDLTAERFLPDPYGPPGSRMYRTGDLVRWNASNVLEFIGRVDHQVKLRGFRIELSEIESTLLEHDAVREAVVVARGDTDKKLVGYLVMRSECTDDDLRVHLKKTLPEYMVPALFVRLAELPHNSSGKIDRKALPAPDFTTAQAEYVAPRTHVEEKLVAIFSEILGIARVGVHDDFFVLGGHSLSAVRIVARARDELRAALPVRALFDAPTVAKLAAVITGTRALSSGPLVPLRRGEGRRLAFFHALSGELFAYGPLAQRLAPFDVSGLRARELATVPESVPALAKHYADALTHDGVVLCGWSMGGLVAFETARELERRGRPPAALVMLDTYVLSAASRREDEPDALAYARDVAWELEPADGAALRTEIERAPHDAIGALVRALRIEERELVDRVRIHATLARAARAYVPDGTPPSTPIHFVAPDPELPLRTWGGRITPRTTSRVPGDHHSMLRSHADALARTFLAILDDE